MQIQQWITKETISKIILPYSKMIQGAFAIEFYKMINSPNWIGNIVLEENIKCKGLDFILVLDKHIRKYNWQFYTWNLKTQLYLAHDNKLYFESYNRDFSYPNFCFIQKHYCIKNNEIINSSKFVTEVKSIIKKN